MTQIETPNRINRQWLKRNTGPAFTLVVFGEEFLTVVAALSWASIHGPGAVSRRHGAYAHQRIVAALPLGAPELTLHRSELMALVDGLEHIIRFPHYTRYAMNILDIIRRGAEQYKQMQSSRQTVSHCDEL